MTNNDQDELGQTKQNTDATAQRAEQIAKEVRASGAAKLDVEKYLSGIADLKRSFPVTARLAEMQLNHGLFDALLDRLVASPMSREAAMTLAAAKGPTMYNDWLDWPQVAHKYQLDSMQEAFDLICAQIRDRIAPILILILAGQVRAGSLPIWHLQMAHPKIAAAVQREAKLIELATEAEWGKGEIG